MKCLICMDGDGICIKIEGVSYNREGDFCEEGVNENEFGLL